jgi:predicted lipid-binding transport protein (Tim44 family)
VSRRSPTNARYQKYTEPKGRTRKSAAAAKPVRMGGGGSTSSKSKSKPKTKPSAAASRGKYAEPDTPEYKYWRKIWWISLLAGMAFVSTSLVLQYVFHAQGPLQIAGVVCMVASYASLIVAFFVDYRKLRPLRQGVTASATAEKSKKSSTSGASKGAGKAAGSETSSQGAVEEDSAAGDEDAIDDADTDEFDDSHDGPT